MSKTDRYWLWRMMFGKKSDHDHIKSILGYRYLTAGLEMEQL